MGDQRPSHLDSLVDNRNRYSHKVLLFKKTKSTVTIKNYQAHYIHIASSVLHSTSHLAVSWKLLQPQADNETDPTSTPPPPP